MRWSDLIAWGILGIFFIVVVVGLQLLVAEPNRENAKREQWEQGYCSALNGQWLAAGVCNVDGKVVTIPKEES
jgi:hypothetical protein